MADVIVYYSRMTVMEIFFSKVTVLQSGTLLRNETLSWNHPVNRAKFFVMAML